MIIIKENITGITNAVALFPLAKLMGKNAIINNRYRDLLSYMYFENKIDIGISVISNAKLPAWTETVPIPPPSTILPYVSNLITAAGI